MEETTNQITIETEEPFTTPKRKPINVKRIVLIVMLTFAITTSVITGLLFGLIVGIATFCSFGISIGILYPFCGTLLNNIINPRPPKRRNVYHQTQSSQIPQN